MSGALEQYRVLDLTHWLNGPWCTNVLAFLGAEVIKLEPLTGDRFRKMHIPPELAAKRDGYEFMSVSCNKKSITLNLQTTRGKEIFADLVKLSDVVVENFTHGVMDRLGFGYDRLRELNPRIVYAVGRGFGDWGPYRDRPAAANVALATSGWTEAAWEGSEWWERQGRPARGTSIPGIGDQACGVSMALGILASLLARERTGRGQMVEVSMQEAMLGFMNAKLHEHFEKSPIGGGSRGLAETADGYYSFSPSGLDDSQWRTLLEAMDREDLLEAPQFATQAERSRHRDEVEELVRSWMRTKTRRELWELLEPLHTTSAPILALEEVLEDPHIKERQAFVEVVHPVAGALTFLAPWVHLSETATTLQSPPPLLGQHNAEIYSKLLGLKEDDLRGLKDAGVI